MGALEKRKGICTRSSERKEATYAYEHKKLMRTHQASQHAS